jgi:uncharacterized protein YciI
MSIADYRFTLSSVDDEQRTVANEISSDVANHLVRCSAKRLWVALAKAVGSQEVIASHVANHLQWMKDMEARGKIWASGPFPKEGILVEDGMTILDASNEGEARSLMDQEPLTKLGLRTYELYPWDLREGRITIQLNASTSTYKMP